MKRFCTLFVGLLLVILFATGCVTATKTVVGTAAKGTRLGAKAAVTTVGTAAKATGSVVGPREKESEPDAQ